MTTDLADQAVEMVLEHNLVPLHLAPCDSIVSERESGLRFSVDSMRIPKGRLPRVYVIHQVFNSCSTEIVGKFMR